MDVGSRYEISVNEQTQAFSIVSSPQANPRDSHSARETLEKIEHVLKNHFHYAHRSDGSDEYAGLSETELSEKLKTMSSEIYQEYSNHLSWFARTFFRKGKQEEEIVARIQTYAPPAPASVLPISNDLTQLTLEYLSVAEIENFGNTGLQEAAQAKIAMERRAKKYGYPGLPNNLPQLLKEVGEAADKNIIPNRYIVKDEEGNVDAEATLEKLEQMTTKDVFSILSNKYSYKKK